jgi:Bacterial regulatory protein, Fis family
VAEAAAEQRRPNMALSEDAMAALSGHGWPGNVRELQNCLRQAVTLGSGPVLKRDDLRLPAPERPGAQAVTDTGDVAVLACLRRHGFDMQATAAELGWDRSTVTQRLKGLGFGALVEAGGDRRRAALQLAGDATLTRVVELKLREYHDHLIRSVAGFETADAAIAACRRRFKNLAERHFRSVEELVRQHFKQ